MPKNEELPNVDIKKIKPYYSLATLIYKLIIIIA